MKKMNGIAAALLCCAWIYMNTVAVAQDVPPPAAEAPAPAAEAPAPAAEAPAPAPAEETPAPAAEAPAPAAEAPAPAAEAPAPAAEAPAPSTEAELIVVLQGDAPLDAKVEACRGLQQIGTEASAPALAPLLGDERLSHYARYVLEPIAGRKVSMVLDRCPRHGTRRPEGRHCGDTRRPAGQAGRGVSGGIAFLSG